MSTDETQRIMRNARRRERFPLGATCIRCGESDARVLDAGTKPILCYACHAAAAGRSVVEYHHIGSRANGDLTIVIGANEHRILSEMQREHDPRLRRNPDGSPVLRAAAHLAGVRDALAVLVERLFDPLITWLLAFETWLVARLGPRYWQQPDFPQLRLC